MSAQLAQFSFGRILLHVVAMLGDRAVRFHAAGILRELPGRQARAREVTVVLRDRSQSR